MQEFNYKGEYVCTYVWYFRVSATVETLIFSVIVHKNQLNLIGLVHDM
jgi:hypothetical protein